jgi:hypothetical protein
VQKGQETGEATVTVQAPTRKKSESKKKILKKKAMERRASAKHRVSEARTCSSAEATEDERRRPPSGPVILQTSGRKKCFGCAHGKNSGALGAVPATPEIDQRPGQQPSFLAPGTPRRKQRATGGGCASCARTNGPSK